MAHPVLTIGAYDASRWLVLDCRFLHHVINLCFERQASLSGGGPSKGLLVIGCSNAIRVLAPAYQRRCSDLTSGVFAPSFTPFMGNPFSATVMTTLERNKLWPIARSFLSPVKFVELLRACFFLDPDPT